MTLDERTLRAAGLPASLISLLVSITKAAERATAAANSAAVASNLEPQIFAAVQALEKMEVVPELVTQIDALSGRLSQIEGTNPIVSLDVEDSRLILVMADGSRIQGPTLHGGAYNPVIVLSGGSLTVSAEDLVITPPVAAVENGGYYTPGEIVVTLFLTRGGLDVTADIQDGRITNAPAGEYTATWTATDGVLPQVTKTISLTVVAGSVPNAFSTNQWSVSGGANPGEIVINVATLPANNGSPITKIEYLLGPDWSKLEGAGVGSRTVMMPEVGAYYEISLRAWNAAGPSAPSAAKGATSGGQATAAPAVTSPPTISGNTTVGSILGGTVGSATGIPAPTASTTWLRNSTILDGQTGDTLDTSGFAVGDVILRHTTWTNNINGQVQSTTATSAPWTLTEQPAITATLPTLTQGQLATIPFNTVPDSVTVTQGGTTLPVGGTGASRTFTPTTTEPVSISALKSGWTAYSAPGLTVQPAAPVVFKDTAYNVIGVDNLQETPFVLPWTAPADYAGNITLSSASALEGPEVVDPPVLTTLSGQPFAVGQTAVFDFGPVIAQTPQPLYQSVQWSLDHELVQTNGMQYLIPAEAAGRYLTGVWVLGDGEGRYTYGQTPDLIIPGSALAAGITQVGIFSAVSASSGERTIPINIGIADPQKRVIVYYVNQSASTPKIVANGVNYPLTVHAQGTLPNGRALALASADIPVGGAANLVIATGDASTNYAYVMAGKNMNFVHGHTLNVWKTTGGGEVGITLQSATAVGDHLTLGILHQAATGGDLYTNPVMVTERHDADLTAIDRHLFIGNGVETAATANRKLAVTIGRTGDNRLVAGVFRNK